MNCFTNRPKSTLRSVIFPKRSTNTAVLSPFWAKIPQYAVAVNAARYRIGVLEKSGVGATEASKIVQKRLDEADTLLAENRVVEAREIWYSLVELYGGNSDLEILIERAQQRLRDHSSNQRERDSP